MPTSQALLSREHRADDESPPTADDPSAIRLLRLPEVGPPFDDDPAAKSAGTTATAATTTAATTTAATTTAATEGPRHGAASTVPSAVSRGQDAAGGADGDWARQFAGLLTEALSGARPVRQILPWTSRRARVQLPALIPLFSSGQRPRVLRVIATRPAPDVIEMTVVAAVGARTRALAVRLQRAESPAPAGRAARLGQAATRPGKAAAGAAPTVSRWLCTDIEAA